MKLIAVTAAMLHFVTIPVSVSAGVSTGLRVGRVTSQDEQVPEGMAPPPGGYGLCVKFIRNRKAQGYIGPELVHVVGRGSFSFQCLAHSSSSNGRVLDIVE